MCESSRSLHMPAQCVMYNPDTTPILRHLRLLRRLSKFVAPWKRLHQCLDKQQRWLLFSSLPPIVFLSTLPTPFSYIPLPAFSLLLFHTLFLVHSRFTYFVGAYFCVRISINSIFSMPGCPDD